MLEFYAAAVVKLKVYCILLYSLFMARDMTLLYAVDHSGINHIDLFSPGFSTAL